VVCDNALNARSDRKDHVNVLNNMAAAGYNGTHVCVIDVVLVCARACVCVIDSLCVCVDNARASHYNAYDSVPKRVIIPIVCEVR
jgi:hypothetical protein